MVAIQVGLPIPGSSTALDAGNQARLVCRNDAETDAARIPASKSSETIASVSSRGAIPTGSPSWESVTAKVGAPGLINREGTRDRATE
jgi:hypothetical protein